MYQCYGFEDSTHLDAVAETGMFGKLLGEGYSGRDQWKNNPAYEGVSNRGPLPRGNYTIEPARQHPVLGPLAMPLQPDPENNMHQRGDFWIHGDNATHDASHGCIVLNHEIRVTIGWEVAQINNALLVIP